MQDAVARGAAASAVAGADHERSARALPESDRLAATHLLVLAQTARALLDSGRLDAAIAMLEETRHLRPRDCDAVLRKLAANRRNDAIRHARGLRII